MSDVTNETMSAARQSPLSCLEAALSYAERGWHVLPLHWIVDGRCSCGRYPCGTDNKTAGKHPRTKRGLSDATTDEITIRDWWEKWPLANVAIRTGEISGIFVVDIDGAEGQKTWRTVKGDKPLSKKEVLVATTGREGGVHLFFKWPEGHVDIKSWSDKERKIDVRANRGYVVAAPSMHVSGRAYKFVTPLALDTELSPCPQWIVDFAKRGKEKDKAKPFVEEASPESLELLSRLAAMIPLPEAENALSAFSPELEGMLRAAAACITFASYDVWFAYCAAFKRLAASDPAWGDKPFEIFHEISARSPRYEGREDCQNKWDQFDENAPRDNPKTYRSLFYDAKKAGWTPEQGHWKALAAIAGHGDIVDRLNAEVAWIRAHQKVYHLGRERYYPTVRDFENDHNRFHEYENSEGKVKPTTEGKWWFMNHDRRRTYDDIVFEPGLPEVVDGCLNIWRPPALAPVEGDVGPFLEVLENVVRDPVERKILLQFLAHIFQRPRERVNWAVILHGTQTGVGKSTLLEFIRSLLGPYAASIGPAELESPFKGYMRQKLFLIAEETNIGHKREFANEFKNNITNDEIFINEKYQPAERFKNYIRWVFLSNDDASIHLDPTDRRYFVIRSGSRKLNTKSHKEWFNGGGNAAVLHHLLNVDLSSFNYPEAPMTSAKADMIDHGRSACELFADRVTDEIAALKETAGDRPMRTIYSISEIKTKFAGGDLRISEMSDNVLSRAFGKLGISSRRFRGSGGRKTYLMFDDSQDWAHTETPAWSEREKEEQAARKAGGESNVVRLG